MQEIFDELKDGDALGDRRGKDPKILRPLY